jgi:hypothetical protein
MDFLKMDDLANMVKFDCRCTKKNMKKKKKLEFGVYLIEYGYSNLGLNNNRGEKIIKIDCCLICYEKLKFKMTQRDLSLLVVDYENLILRKI